MDKKAGLSQPLGIRRDYGDYDEVDSAVVKPLPPVEKVITPEDAIQGLVPSIPDGRDYDTVTPIMQDDNKGCGRPMMGPATNSMDVECPYCKDTNKFVPDGDEDMEKEVIILCPKCANSVHISDFVKTASGKFTAKVATCLDGEFKTIRRLLPKKDELTLSSKDVKEIHKKLDKIYETYRKFEKELGK